METHESCKGVTVLDLESRGKREKYHMNSKTIITIVAGSILCITLAAMTMISARQTSEATAWAEEVPAPEAGIAPKPEPEIELEPLICLDCHRAANIDTNEGVMASQAFCYDCHKDKTCVRKKNGNEFSLQVVPEAFDKEQPRHRFIACIDCHTDVARSPHKSVIGAQCRECHPVHGEKTAHDPHLRVACQACHYESKPVELDAETGLISLARKDAQGNAVSLTGHILADMDSEATCEKCHTADNTVGAPSSVLPSKGFICILCHNSPLAMGHPIFGLAFLVFLAGIFFTLYFWYQGKVCGEEKSIHQKIALSSESLWTILFSRQFFSLLKVFILDIVLQRRILKESIQRWAMHALIFTAILLRLTLALFTSVGFALSPESDMMLALIDKNHPFTAFANDLLGLFILLGVLWATVQRYIIKPVHVKTEIQDNLALILIGFLVIIGFALEAVRIGTSGIPIGISGGAFIGAPLAALFSALGLARPGVYSFLWYVHGITAALFIAYLPFGKMRHMFNTPLTYFIEKVSGVKRGERV